MNDFLTALAARTLGTASVITPRRPSRFEPTAADRGVTIDEAANETDSAGNPQTSAAFPTPIRATTPSLNQRRASNPAASPGLLPRTSSAAAPSLPVAPGLAARSAPAFNASAPLAHSSAESRDQATTKRTGFRPREQPLPTKRVHSEERREPPPVNAVPPPAIHISIGRVEVRAIHRPASDKPSHTVPQPPRRSLNEYLQANRS